jgi:thiol-disulfide isomerase/thioredoxin
MAPIDAEIDALFRRFTAAECRSMDLTSCASTACDAVAKPRVVPHRAGRIALLLLMWVLLALIAAWMARPTLFGAAADVEEIEDPSALMAAPGKPVALLLWATWCGHCKELKPQFAALAREFRQLRFASCENEALQRSGQGEKLQVSAFPTVLAVNTDGSVADRLVGNQGPQALRAFLGRHAGGSREA